MITCTCGEKWKADSHYGISIKTFGKCPDCLIKDDDFDEGKLSQIFFIAGDIGNSKLMDS